MKLKEIFERFAFVENDTDDQRFSKNLIITISSSCCFFGLVWGGLYYFFLGYGLTMYLPWLFVLFIGITIPIAHFKKNHFILVNAQLTGITWISALVQWSLGSTNDSGFVVIWSFLGPIGALLFTNKKQSIFWMGQFLLIMLVTVIVEPKLSSDSKQVTDVFRETFFLMNVCTTCLIVFGTSLYFVRDILRKKNLNFALLKSSETKNKELLDSIKYAKRIQNAIMPSEKQLSQLIPNGFVFYQPKDIVAGDFYWLNQKDNNLYIASCDCTGHGVPGALVSVVCNAALNRSLKEFSLTKPGEILDKTRELVLQEFEKSEDEVSDGMDIALIKINGNRLSFSGANNPLWIIRNDSNLLEDIKGCKQSIGLTNHPTPFVTHELKLSTGDCVYIFTDGYADQFGGIKGKKFKTKAFKKLLQSVNSKSIIEQKIVIETTMKDWKGVLEQVDDICIIGLKIN
jgi:serine phosphatase RsbU (regulator of sigma subunit)